MRYRLNYDGVPGTGLNTSIPSVGGASPDLLTDSKPGAMKRLARAVLDGFGRFAAGAKTTAQSRALWQSDYSGADPGIKQTAKAKSTLFGASTQLQLTLSADVNAGNPLIRITVFGDTSAAANWFVDFVVDGAIGQ